MFTKHQLELIHEIERLKLKRKRLKKKKQMLKIKQFMLEEALEDSFEQEDENYHRPEYKDPFEDCN
jgi:hypothetical protein